MKIDYTVELIPTEVIWYNGWGNSIVTSLDDAIEISWDDKKLKQEYLKKYNMTIKDASDDPFNSPSVQFRVEGDTELLYMLEDAPATVYSCNFYPTSKELSVQYINTDLHYATTEELIDVAYKLLYQDLSTCIQSIHIVDFINDLCVNHSLKVDSTVYDNIKRVVCTVVIPTKYGSGSEIAAILKLFKIPNTQIIVVADQEIKIVTTSGELENVFDQFAKKVGLK